MTLIHAPGSSIVDVMAEAHDLIPARHTVTIDSNRTRTPGDLTAAQLAGLLDSMVSPLLNKVELQTLQELN